MFRELRRKDRAMNDLEVQAVLGKGEYGILASVGNDAFPYAIPYSYAMLADKIYIHCTSKQSHTKDNVQNSEKVCFTVVGKTERMPDKFATNYESVVVFGTAKEITDTQQKIAALRGIIQKYSADYVEEGEVYIEKMFAATSVIEIVPLHVSGKARRKEGESNLEYLKKS